MLEFITGGGLAGQPLPPGLLAEGEMMLQALLRDVRELASGCSAAEPALECTVLRDARLDIPAACAAAHAGMRVVRVPAAGALDALWAQLLRGHDAALPVAPETDGVLERLSRAAETAGTVLWSPDADTVARAASKAATLQCLQQAGVPVVPCGPLHAPPPAGPLGWVVKPDDGVGCERLRIVEPAGPSEDALARQREGTAATEWLVQPFLPGTPASLSLLCAGGRAGLFAVNALRMLREGTGLRLSQLQVNGLWRAAPGLRALAAAVAGALPGLRGWVGVDLLLTADGPRVLEVNPRLTTAYAGLRASLGHNPVALLQQCLAGSDPSALAATLSSPRPVTLPIPAGAPSGVPA